MAGDKDGSLSAREMEVLALAWQCMDAPPKIDMQKLALLTGYTPGSAAVTMGNIKRKLKQRSGDASTSSAPSTPKRGSAAAGRSRTMTPKSSTGKRGASASASATPSKRAKSGGRQGKKIVAKEEEDDANDANDDDDVPMSGGARVKKEVLDEGLEYGGGEDGESGVAMLKGVGWGGDEEVEEE
ncbi:hypothetical protein J1614_007805 [Plenodomus biglobosus]|nr:hypothetical protein J1614_007805 [Plenodomus biglobosus]